MTKQRKPFDWLNESSRKFLEGGYLTEGVTPEQRIRNIADNAESILGIEGYADKFYDYMSKGYYSLSSPVWANFGESRGLPISCVTGDTWINTSDGGKQAKDVEIGDLLLTHKNRFKEVTNVIPTENRGDIWKLKVNTRLTNLYITGDHRVLTNTGWKRVDELDANKDLIAVNGELEYEEKKITIDMKEFVDYEYIIEDGLIKKKTENKRKDAALRNNKSKTHVTYYATYPEFIELDDDLMWAFGLWFADGSLSKNNKGIPNGIRLTMGTHDEDTINKWSEIVSEKFGVNYNVYKSNLERNGKTHQWLSSNANGKVLGNLFRSFGDGSKDIRLHEEWLDLPKSQLSSFLGGMLVGDGYEEGVAGRGITISNPNLLLQLYQIGLKLGKSMSLQMQEKAGKFSSTVYVYKLTFRDYKNTVSRSSAAAGIPFSDGLIYAPIKTLEKTEKVEDVFDFTVKDDHSFSATGVVVHNCYSIDIQDDMGDIMRATGEIGIMSKLGGGTGGYFGNLRPRGAEIKDNGESSGSVHFMELFDSLMDVASQGKVRRGSFSPYLPIEHADIDEFLKIGTEGNAIQGLTHAVTVTDEWLQSMVDGDVDKRKTWAKVIQSRVEMGYPYIFFKDTVNNGTVDVYKDKGLEINHSNLCSEITLPTNEDWSFVCCLSSMNLLHYDEWKDTDAVETLVYFLDAVMTEFIMKLEDMRDSGERDKQRVFFFMEKAYNFAKENRALGLGALGWHSYLQSNMIPFESLEATKRNAWIFREIEDKAYKASKELADMFGEPAVLEGYGRRNTTLLAVAPTTSSAFILGQVSQSIEPLFSNTYVKDLAKAKVTVRNPYLREVLKSYDKDDRETWNSIRDHDGSVQHLDFLTDNERDVFKTFNEINQYVIIDQAAIRQQFIDQSQSLNIMVNPKMSAKEMNELYLFAWRNGVKTLYYQHSTSAAQQFSKDKICIACEG